MRRLAASIIAIILILETYMLVVEPHVVTIHTINIDLDGFNGLMRIIHLSDLHIRSFGLKERIIIQEVSALKPDLIVMTGDYVEFKDSVRHLHRFINVLRDHVGGVPIIAVYGNRDYSTGASESISRVFRDLNITLLINNVVSIPIKGVRLVIIGLDDMIEGKPDLSIVKRVPPGNIVVVLAHEPELALRALSLCRGICIAFAGHCHGGQFRIIKPIILPYGCPADAYEGVHDIEGNILVVSRGLGESRIPARFLATPEIIVVNLM